MQHLPTKTLGGAHLWRLTHPLPGSLWPLTPINPVWKVQQAHSGSLRQGLARARP